MKTKKIKKPDVYQSLGEGGFYLIEPDEDAQGNELWSVSFKKSSESYDWEHVKSFSSRAEAKAYIDREVRRHNSTLTFAEEVKESMLGIPGALPCSSDYRETIVDMILEDVLSDIMTTSAYPHWNEDDVALAVGRLLFDRFK